MITIILVRHGKTELNEKLVIMGQTDSPLLEESLKTSKKIAKSLEKLKLDHIFSSDLGRAFMTAFSIAKELNLINKFSYSKSLREINYGIYAHWKKEDVKKKCLQYKKDKNYIFPDGESFLQVQKRAIKFIKYLEQKYKNKTILLVSHAGVIRAIKSYYNEWDYDSKLDLKIPHNYIGKFIIENNKFKEIS